MVGCEVEALLDETVVFVANGRLWGRRVRARTSPMAMASRRLRPHPLS